MNVEYYKGHNIAVFDWWSNEKGIQSKFWAAYIDEKHGPVCDTVAEALQVSKQWIDEDPNGRNGPDSKFWRG